MKNSGVAASHKFASLDSLRGIAALMVIFQHFWEMSYPADARLKPWYFFCAGHEAVILFFVLSGFVLSHQLREFRGQGYWPYLARRIARIYPAYYLSLIVSALLLISLRQAPPSLSNFNLTQWFYIWQHTTFDQTMFYGSFSLILHEGNSLNLATWSLFYEMWLSLAFPWLLMALVHRGWRIRIWFISSLGLVSLLLAYSANWLDNAWAGIIYYTWYFLGGMLLYQVREQLQHFSGAGSLTIGILLYFCNYFGFGFVHNRLVHELIIALGSSLLLLNALYYPAFQRGLEWWPWQFYGKISYSLYLLHLPVLYGLVYWCLPTIGSIWLIKLVTLVVASVLASISYRWLELPLSQAVKRLLHSYG